MLIPFKIGKRAEVLPENENKIEGHLEAASIHHKKAAYYLKEGDYEKSAQNAIIAKKHLDLASEIRREEMYSEQVRTKSA